MDVTDHLPGWRRPLAVVAHPDDESFGLGALLSTFEASGAEPAVLCFTPGEASALQASPVTCSQCARRSCIGQPTCLGIDGVDLRDEPNGGLAARGQETLAAAVRDAVTRRVCDGMVAFDLGGVTGHPDHDASTRAAITAGGQLGLGVLGWRLPEKVAAAVNDAFPRWSSCRCGFTGVGGLLSSRGCGGACGAGLLTWGGLVERPVGA